MISNQQTHFKYIKFIFELSGAARENLRGLKTKNTK